MYRNSSFLISLKHALCGFLYAVKSERNLRFHICVADLIFVFAHFYGLDRTGFAVLTLTVFAVIEAELFNTATERAVDTATEKICENAKNAKDTASAAVLTTAFGAVGVGICLFGDGEKIMSALKALFTTAFSNPATFIVLLGILIFDIWLLFFCGRKGKEIL